MVASTTDSSATLTAQKSEPRRWCRGTVFAHEFRVHRGHLALGAGSRVFVTRVAERQLPTSRARVPVRRECGLQLGILHRGGSHRKHGRLDGRNLHARLRQFGCVPRGGRLCAIQRRYCLVLGRVRAKRRLPVGVRLLDRGQRLPARLPVGLQLWSQPELRASLGGLRSGHSSHRCRVLAACGLQVRTLHV